MRFVRLVVSCAWAVQCASAGRVADDAPPRIDGCCPIVSMSL